MLANKFRPQFFRDVLGQPTAVNIFRNSVARNMVQPVYVLAGPFGTGKTSLARILAKSIQCGQFQVEQEPCGQCESCLAIQKDSSFHYEEIDAASNGSVDQVRQLIADSQYANVGGKRKIVVLDEAHQLSGAAQDALLKLFESGSSNVVYLLCTTEKGKLKPTLLSRAVGVDFRLVDEELILQRLEFVCDEEVIPYRTEALQLLAKLSKGHARDALNVLGQISLQGDVTVEAVKSHFNLDKQEKYLQLLLDLSGDLEKSLAMLDDVLDNASEADVYRGLVEALLSADRWGKGYRSNDIIRQDLLAEVSTVYSDKALPLANFLLRHKGGLTRSHLECDLLLLDEVVSGRVDLWALVTEGRMKRVVLPSESGVEKVPSKREARMLMAHKRQDKLPVAGTTEEATQVEPEAEPEMASFDDLENLLGGRLLSG